MLLSAHGKKSLSAGCFLKSGPIESESLISVILHVHDWKGSRVLIIPFIRQYLY
jgi:hypothetical protein